MQNRTGAKMRNKTIDKILAVLGELYPEPKTELIFSTPFQLLVATMLSAQTTDRQVNAITAGLFKKYSTPQVFAALSQETLENEIKSCGLYKNKAKNIIAASRTLVEKYGSQVPDSLDLLVNLPGVGRKTANVVLANAFGRDVIAVDTHVFRVANRLGLAASDTPEKTEQDLLQSIPPGLRNNAHHWLIFHGRRVCRAQNPKCGECGLSGLCRYVRK